MEFLVPALDDYVDLSRSYFTLELTVKRNNGANLDAANKLWVTNNLAHTIIKQITMRLNGTLISPQTDTYPYKSYFETLLNYNREHGDTLLKPKRWFTALDHPAQWTANNTDTTCNYGQGHTDYRGLSANHKKALATSIAETSNYLYGKTHTMMFQPHLEAFHAGKVLVPQVEIRMRFYFSSPDFFLKGVAIHGRLSEDDMKIRFHLCQLRLHSDVYNSLSEERHDEREIASYPTVRSEIRTFSTQGTQAGFEANNLFQGRIPDRLIVGLVRNEAFNGNVAFNPFSFQKFGVSSIKKIVKGEEHPYETLQLIHNSGDKDLAGYFRFLQANGDWCKKQSGMVQKDDWGQNKNCTLFMFDNVAHGCADSNMLNPKQSGDLQLVIEFGAASGVTITIIIC